MSSEELKLLWRWSELKKQKAALDAEEKDLRASLFDTFFPQAAEGSKTLSLPDGWKLKGTKKINRTLVREEFANATAEDITVLYGTGVLVAKPEFVLSAFRKLEPDTLRVVEKYIEIKPGLPELELVPPKEKK